MPEPVGELEEPHAIVGRHDVAAFVEVREIGHAGAEPLLVVRLLRMLRVFRIFKLSNYLVESNVLLIALQRSQRKVSVFLFTVMLFVIVLGTVMFVVEGPEHGFTSVPVSMYWAVVTVTTVGYGDISPATPLGQAIASVAIILGYAISTVPTGIV
jgi:voltage-gated potassium channel